MSVLAILLFLSQDYSQRGFVQTQTTVYPQAAVNDGGHVVGDFELRYEGFYKPWADLQLAGTVDLRTDTHHQTEREVRFDWKDRTRQRPMLSLRRLSVQYHRGEWSVEAGKQFVRWGRTDIVNPTDRFAPRDYLTVVDNDFLAVDAARATYERGSNTVDVIWVPRLTPSRVPLFSQRWFVPPPGASSFPSLVVDRRIPEGSQAGVRWSHTGAVEFAAAFYSGFDHLPSYALIPGTTTVDETYAKQRMVGGDVGIPLPVVAIKGEAAWFQDPDHRSDDYLLYVIQLERQAGEWFFVAGYGGQHVTRSGSQAADFNPVRGMTRTILSRAGYTVDVNRSLAFETAIRENFDGFWSKFEYSQAFGQHWRLTTAMTLIRGKPTDFLGQYRENSHATITTRYSF
jgi:hypothetical protein